MGELKEDYEGEAEFVVVPAEETARRTEEIVAFGFEDAKHGLVVFGPDGEVAETLPGHQFGRAEIEAALQRVLADG